jgi:CubicO group peptidase (beta-lactamase class C family)
VFHEGKVIFRDSIGYRDFEQKLSATSDTVYPIGSLSKAFTASIYGSLVDEWLVNWDSLIRDILPDFRSVSSEIENLATAIDLLSYRTGITEGDAILPRGSPSIIKAMFQAQLQPFICSQRP